jgi:hypothetical protein
MASPIQSLPCGDGFGFVQALERVIVPPPHVTVQLPQVPQSDQPPSEKAHNLLSDLIIHNTF